MVLLLLAVVGKTMGLVQESLLMGYPNPIFPFLSYRTVVMVAIMVEVGVLAALVVFHAKRPIFCAGCLAWLVGLFVMYRLGLAFVGFPNQCNCFGLLGDLLQSNMGLGDWLGLGTICVMLVTVGAGLGIGQRLCLKTKVTDHV